MGSLPKGLQGWSMEGLRNAVAAREITVDVAAALISWEKLAKKNSRKAVIDCDLTIDKKGLSAREITYCNQVALAELGRFGWSKRQIAAMAGFSRADLDRLERDAVIQSRIRDYKAQHLLGGGYEIADLRAVALERLASTTMASVGDLYDYGDAHRTPIRPIVEGDQGLYTSESGLLLDDNVDCEYGDDRTVANIADTWNVGITTSIGDVNAKATRTHVNDGVYSEVSSIQVGQTYSSTGIVDGGVCEGTALNRVRSSHTSEFVPDGGTESNTYLDSISRDDTSMDYVGEGVGGVPQRIDGAVHQRGGPLPKIASNFSAQNEISAESENSPSTKKSSSVACAANEREPKKNEYFSLSDGTKIRLKQLDELPPHLSAAVKTLKFKNIGVRKNADGSTEPIIVPEIELHDGIRAAELLLKYNGDIGATKKELNELDFTDIASVIDNARRRANSKREGKVIETTLSEVTNNDDCSEQSAGCDSAGSIDDNMATGS